MGIQSGWLLILCPDIDPIYCCWLPYLSGNNDIDMSMHWKCYILLKDRPAALQRTLTILNDVSPVGASVDGYRFKQLLGLLSILALNYPLLPGQSCHLVVLHGYLKKYAVETWLGFVESCHCTSPPIVTLFFLLDGVQTEVTNGWMCFHAVPSKSLSSIQTMK